MEKIKKYSNSRLRIFENSALKRIFEPKTDKEQETGENYVSLIRRFIAGTPLYILLLERSSNRGE
jgi:CRISPR/Cas system-associated protein Csx1